MAQQFSGAVAGMPVAREESEREDEFPVYF
jgi:hypothetical protein